MVERSDMTMMAMPLDPFGLERRMVSLDEAQRRARFDAEAMRHLDALYAFALKLTRARDEAEDLVSDTMLRAIQRWEQYRLGTNIRAWLFTILYHAFVSRKRRVDAREVQPLEDEEGRMVFEAVGETDPEGTFYDSFLDEEIVGAIQALPDEYRLAVVMSDLHGLKYAGDRGGARRPRGDGEVATLPWATDPAGAAPRLCRGDGLPQARR